MKLSELRAGDLFSVVGREGVEQPVYVVIQQHDTLICPMTRVSNSKDAKPTMMEAKTTVAKLTKHGQDA